MKLKNTIPTLALTLLIPYQVIPLEIPVVKVSYSLNITVDEYYARIIPKEYLPIIFKSSSDYGIPLYILTALIYIESRYDPKCISHNKNGRGSDEGLMQLNSRNKKEFAERFNNGQKYDPFDPSTNLRIGCQYLLWIYNNQYIGKGNWYKTLVFWNGSKESSKRFAKFILGIS